MDSVAVDYGRELVFYRYAGVRIMTPQDHRYLGRSEGVQRPAQGVPVGPLLAPSAAQRSDTARPIPLPPPVTATVLPSTGPATYWPPVALSRVCIFHPQAKIDARVLESIRGIALSRAARRGPFEQQLPIRRVVGPKRRRTLRAARRLSATVVHTLRVLRSHSVLRQLVRAPPSSCTV